MPTEFGPIDLCVRLSDEGQTLKVDYSAQFHSEPVSVVLHVPPVSTLERVVLSGKSLKVKPGKSAPPQFASTYRDYSGRAAILSRERLGAFLAPSHPPLISS